MTSAHDGQNPAPQTPLSATASDPRTLGWMQGAPPPPDKLLRVADDSFFTFPALRWSVVHMRQFLPTVEVSRGLGAPTSLAYEPDDRIDAITFRPWGTNEPLTWEAALARNYTDGVLVLHRGTIVYERYLGALAADRQHAAMSVTKSLTGTLAAALVAEGTLDAHAAVTHSIPELRDSGFAGATVRQVMDMTTDLDFSEDYADPDAEIWQYGAASSPMPKPADYTGPVGYYAYLRTVRGAGKHGEAFGYRTVNADALGWLVARAAGQSVADLLAARVWRRLGMEQVAYYQVDELGTPFAGGGLSAGLRDLARFGELLRTDGAWHGEQILPRAAIADIRRGGSTAAFARSGHPELRGWSYRNMWWITNNEHGAFAARGVHGQTIYIDPTAEMVIVRFASHPVAANKANDGTSLPAYHAVARHLIDR